MDPLYIKPLKTDSAPGLIVVLDTETLPEFDRETNTGFHRIRLGVAIAWRIEKGKVNRRRVFRFSHPDDFWDWLYPRLKPRQPTWLFAHNLGFDLTGLGFWNLLETKEYGFTRDSVGLDTRWDQKGTGRKWSGFLCAEDPPTIISVIHRTGGRLTMVDTLNYFRTPLAELGKSAGLDKLPMPDWSADDDEWFEYCQRDAEILEATVGNLLHWWRESRLGKFAYTAAGLAIESYRRRFLPQWIELHHNPDVRRLEREAYFGGRLELFFKGKVSTPDKVTHLDVNGLYPFIMCKHKFPFRLTDCSADSGPLPPERLTEKHIAQVRVRALGDGFPYRCKLGLIFPRGEYWTTLAGPELMRAVRTGAVLEVGDWSRYSFAWLFRDYVNHFWAERQKHRESGDLMRERFCKLMMNSLYGKFGQRYGRWQSRTGIDPMTPWGEWHIFDATSNTISRFRGIGNITQEATERGEHKKAFPAIAAWVTSHAREYMRRLYHSAGVGHVYYTVTDSLFVDRFGFDNLERQGVIDQHRLGALKVKHAARTAEFDALHWWRLGQERKRGNLKPDAIPLDNDGFEQTYFEGLREILKSEPAAGVHTTTKVLRFDRSERRGTVDRLGWVTPLYIDPDPLRDDIKRKPTAG